MSLEPLVLAVASALRPAALAATYALLSRSHPRRLLILYIAAGYAFSAALGIAAVTAFHGNYLSPPSAVGAVPDLIVGAAALGFAGWVASGRGLIRTPDDPAAVEPWALRQLRDPSIRAVMAVGVATHLPGLFYLLALNAILAEQHTRASEVTQVLIFNAIWFSASLAAVFFVLVRPSGAKDTIGRLIGWLRQHERPIVFAVFSVIGIYLVADGIIQLAG